MDVGSANLQGSEPRVLGVVAVRLDAHVDGLGDLVGGHVRFVGEGREEVPGDPLVVREGLVVEEDARRHNLEAGEHIGVDLAEQLEAIQRNSRLKELRNKNVCINLVPSISSWLKKKRKTHAS